MIKKNEFDFFLAKPNEGYVYILFDDMDLIAYVGQTKSFFGRLAQHKLRSLKIVKVKFYIVNSTDLIKTERDFIEKFKPYINYEREKLRWRLKEKKELEEKELKNKTTSEKKESFSLRDYMYLNHLTNEDISNLTEISKSYIDQIKHNRKKPSKRLAKIIEEKTNGQVTVKELRGQE